MRRTPVAMSSGCPVSAGAQSLRVQAQSVEAHYCKRTSSCKFFGDRVRLCGRLLGEPQGLPRLRACDPLEAAQGCAACRTPTPPRGLLACPTALLDPCVQPATAQGLARPLAAAGSDALRLRRLDGGDERLPGLGGGGAHGGLEGRAGRGRAPGPQGVPPARDGDRCRLLGACAPAPPRPPLWVQVVPSQAPGPRLAQPRCPRPTPRSGTS